VRAGKPAFGEAVRRPTDEVVSATALRRQETSGGQDRRARLLEERLLFARYRRRRDPADRDALVRRFLPLAHALATRFRHTREPYDDLFQVACLGLVNAIDRYDVERRTAFSSYAVPTIVGEIKRHFRDRTWPVAVPRDVKELALKVSHSTEELTGRRGGPPSVADLALALGITEGSVLDARLAGAVYESIALEDSGADDIGQAEAGYGRAEQRMLLEELLRFLTLRQRQVVRLRFGEELTQQQIGERVGLSQMQVSRILREAVQRLGEVVVSPARAQ
jgi:RNA polymerase sigma-B factor